MCYDGSCHALFSILHGIAGMYGGVCFDGFAVLFSVSFQVANMPRGQRGCACSTYLIARFPEGQTIVLVVDTRSAEGRKEEGNSVLFSVCAFISGLGWCGERLSVVHLCVRLFRSCWRSVG